MAQMKATPNRSLLVKFSIVLLASVYSLNSWSLDQAKVCKTLADKKLPAIDELANSKWTNSDHPGVSIELLAKGQWKMLDPENPIPHLQVIQGGRAEVITDSFAAINNGQPSPFLFLKFQFFNGLYFHLTCKEQKIQLCNAYCLSSY